MASRMSSLYASASSIVTITESLYTSGTMRRLSVAPTLALVKSKITRHHRRTFRFMSFPSKPHYERHVGAPEQELLGAEGDSVPGEFPANAVKISDIPAKSDPIRQKAGHATPNVERGQVG